MLGGSEVRIKKETNGNDEELSGCTNSPTPSLVEETYIIHVTNGVIRDFDKLQGDEQKLRYYVRTSLQ